MSTELRTLVWSLSVARLIMILAAILRQGLRA